MNFLPGNVDLIHIGRVYETTLFGFSRTRWVQLRPEFLPTRSRTWPGRRVESFNEFASHKINRRRSGQTQTLIFSLPNIEFTFQNNIAIFCTNSCFLFFSLINHFHETRFCEYCHFIHYKHSKLLLPKQVRQYKYEKEKKSKSWGKLTSLGLWTLGQNFSNPIIVYMKRNKNISSIVEKFIDNY